MIKDYDYGPNLDFNIRFVGDMKKYNGSYEDSSEKNQYLVQSLCHMIYQIKYDIQSSSSGILRLNGIWIQYLHTRNGDEYSVYTNDMMTVFHIIETGLYSFDFEFLSPKQCYKADALIDYAYEHRMDFGRAK